jgi:hypothetical protein
MLMTFENFAITQHKNMNWSKPLPMEEGIGPMFDDIIWGIIFYL